LTANSNNLLPSENNLTLSGSNLRLNSGKSTPCKSESLNWKPKTNAYGKNWRLSPKNTKMSKPLSLKTSPKSTKAAHVPLSDRGKNEICAANERQEKTCQLLKFLFITNANSSRDKSCQQPLPLALGKLQLTSKYFERGLVSRKDVGSLL
jgi:hypothetical protein